MNLGVSGVIPAIKPKGMTSKDVSRLIQRRYGKLKIGHVGTLDPDAEGVLPILIGDATKLQDYLLELPKTYFFVVKLGSATDTLDASGTVTETKSFGHITAEKIQELLPKFIGPINQTPPIYSAVKFRGRELYKHARAGLAELSKQDQEKLSRNVTVYQIELVEFVSDKFSLRVRCSKGTYVRTLADDLCRRLNTVGHVTTLRREESAGFSLSQCIGLDTVLAESSSLVDHIQTSKTISIGLPIWRADDNVLIRRIKDGQRVRMSRSHFELGIRSSDASKCYEGGVFLVRDVLGDNVGIAELVEPTENYDHAVIHLKRGL